MYPPIGQGLDSILNQLVKDYSQNPQTSPLGIQMDSSNDLQQQLAGINSQYQPTHQFSDQLAQMIQQFPQRAPEPTGWKGLLARAMSLDPHPVGIEMGQPIGYQRTKPLEFEQNYEAVTQAPFHRSLNDWLTKVKPVEAGATDERYNNSNQRMWLNSEARSAISANRADTAARNQQSLDTSRRAAADAAVERNRMKEEEIVIKNKLLALKLPDSVKIQLQEQMREKFARIDRALQMNNTAEAIRLRGEVQDQMIRLQGEVTKGVEAARSAGIANRPDAPTQFSERAKNNGIQAGLAHPEWITNEFINQDGTINLANVAAADPETQRAIMAEIYGTAATGTQPSSNTGTAGQSITVPPSQLKPPNTVPQPGRTDIDLPTGKPARPDTTPPANVRKDFKLKTFRYRSKKDPSKTAIVPERDAKLVDPNLWEFVGEVP